MTPEQYRAALSRLGITQLQAAKLFRDSLRTHQNYAAGKYPVPWAVGIVLIVLESLLNGALDLDKLVEPATHNRRSKDQRDN